MTLLDEEYGQSPILMLDPRDITVQKVTKSETFDKEFFPVRNYLRKKVKSPDNKYTVERRKVRKKYSLYLTNLSTGKTRKVKYSKNGYAPQWSWNSRYIIFTHLIIHLTTYNF